MMLACPAVDVLRKDDSGISPFYMAAQEGHALVVIDTAGVAGPIMKAMFEAALSAQP